MGLDVESRDTIDEAIDRVKAAIREDGETLLAHVQARLEDLLARTLMPPASDAAGRSGRLESDDPRSRYNDCLAQAKMSYRTSSLTICAFGAPAAAAIGLAAAARWRREHDRMSAAVHEKMLGARMGVDCRTAFRCAASFGLARRWRIDVDQPDTGRSFGGLHRMRRADLRHDRRRPMTIRRRSNRGLSVAQRRRRRTARKTSRT